MMAGVGVPMGRKVLCKAHIKDICYTRMLHHRSLRRPFRELPSGRCSV